MLYHRVLKDPSLENNKALQQEINDRMKIDSIMDQLFSHHFESMKNGTLPLPTDFECYRSLVNNYEEKCGKLSDYGMKYLKLMVAECESIKAFPAAIDST